MGSYDGRFFDGKTAASRAARVSLAAQGVMINVAGARQAQIWLYGDLVAPEALPADSGTRLTSRQAPDAQLVVADAAFRADLLRMLPHYAGHAGRWRRHRGEVGIVLSILAVVAAVLFGLPYVADPLARVMPRSWDVKLGEITMLQLTRGQRVCERPAGLAALQAMLQPLLRVSGYGDPILVQVVDHPMVNAFAAAGGHIVFMRGLIERAETADEVAGVLAHELGHVMARHPTANAIRVLGVLSFVDLILGDSGAVVEALGQGGALLLLFAYTRADEAEADAIALGLLDEAGIDTGGFADFFRRLDRRGGKGEAETAGGGADRRVLDYFSTHPATGARERQARAAAGQGRRPALESGAWGDLRAICGEDE